MSRVTCITFLILSSISHGWTNAKRYGNDICELCSCRRDYWNLYHISIDCANRVLSKMPDFPSDYVNISVTSYYLEGNLIKTVSKFHLQQFPNLEKLDLSRNEIYVITPSAFANISQLRTLDLYQNRISVIPAGLFEKLKNLEHLDLSNNQISVIPSGAFASLHSLTYLDSSTNKITFIPPRLFHDIHKLSLLDFSNNEISVIPSGAFSKLSNLLYLYLNNNTISTIHVSMFSNMSNLQFLRLNNNKISVVLLGGFDKLLNVQSLYLTGNKMLVIPPGLFSRMPKLQFLYTSGLIDCCNAYRVTLGGLVACNDVPPPYVQCGLRIIPEKETRANVTRHTSVGIVNVYDNEGWRAFCDVSWTKADADVTCEELGFPDAVEALILTPTEYNWNETVVPKDYKCTGKEDYLRKCLRSSHRHSTDSISNQCSNKTAGVRCRSEGERLCKVCNCTSYSVDCSNRHLLHVPWSRTTFGQTMTRFNISNNKIRKIWTGLFAAFPTLKSLDISSNLISDINGNLLKFSRNLTHLNMAHNQITKIPSTFLHGLLQLKELNLSSNSLSEISDILLKFSKQLQFLDLSNNKLEILPRPIFSPGNQLEYLNLGNNLFKTIHPNSMKNLENLKILDISGMLGLYIESWRFLLPMKNLNELRASDFSQCCFVKKERPDINCSAPPDSFSDCDKMIKSAGLRYIAWIVLVGILGGNLIAIILRIACRETNHVQNILFLNLSIGDLLIGICVAAIVNRDLEWSGDYYLYDREWRSSAACKSFGVLSLLSSEVSVLTLAVLTYQQHRKIVHGPSYMPIGPTAVKFIVVLIWLLSVVLTVIPALVENYFYSEEKGAGYYGTNSLCVPLQLPGEKDPAWEYCLAIFGALNFVVSCCMVIAYSTIFYAGCMISKKADIRRQLTNGPQMTGRLAIIVFTDISCWFAIAMLIFISLAKKMTDTDNLFYAWFSICVATINSAINPLVSTITVPFYWIKCKEWLASITMQCSQHANKPESETVVLPEDSRTVATEMADDSLPTQRQSCNEQLESISLIQRTTNENKSTTEVAPSTA